jgi:hypothetical protein
MSEDLIIVKISTNNSKFPELLLRQTPSSNGIWGNCKFYVNQKVEKCDWWVVCHVSGLETTETVKVDPNHIIYISMEPTESIGKTTNKFLEQFSKILICDRSIRHKDIIYKNCSTWWAGINISHKNNIHTFSNTKIINYDQFISRPRPLKSKLISIIISKKNFLEGHKKRLKFLDQLLKSEVGQYIEVYGAGHKNIQDKLDAIAPYKYHIVLENHVEKDYWSEKLADSYLGYSIPIYYGCPNIKEYFPDDFGYEINIDNPDQSINKIKNIIACDEYYQKINTLDYCFDLIINKHNIFQILENICNKKANIFQIITLHTNDFFRNGVVLRFLQKRYKFLKKYYKI